MISYSILLKGLRSKMKFSQEEIADKLHMSVRSYRDLEAGKTRLDAERMEQLATIYGVSKEAIFHNDNNTIVIEKILNVNSVNTQNDPHLHEEVGKLKIELLERLIEQQREEITYLRSLIKNS